MDRIWAVCSGSGGVGKSTIALALAAGAAKSGLKTILLDASGISRSCDLLLGMESIVSLDMMDVLNRETDIQSALYPVSRYPGLRFACASLYDHHAVSELSSIVLTLDSLCDLLVIDLPTGDIGVGRGILRSGDERIIITRPDAPSVRASERLMQHCMGDMAGTTLVINRMLPERGKRDRQYSRDAVQNTLDRVASGVIPEDSSIAVCEEKARAAIECDGPAKSALRDLLKTLLQAV